MKFVILKMLQPPDNQSDTCISSILVHTKLILADQRSYGHDVRNSIRRELVIISSFHPCYQGNIIHSCVGYMRINFIVTAVSYHYEYLHTNTYQSYA